MIISRTPFRISFFGGGTDYPAWYREHGGAVLATTINKYCYLTCRYLPPFFEHKFRVVWSHIENCQSIDEITHPVVREALRYLKVSRGVEIHHDGDLPARSGIGSSSSFTVGLLHALHGLMGKMPTKHQLATESTHVERDMLQEVVGDQDQFMAAFGGLNHIEFNPSGQASVAPVTLPAGRIEELNAHLMVLYSGIKRTASNIATSLIHEIPGKKRELRLLRELVKEGLSILNSGQDLTRFGELLHENWLIKRELCEGVTNTFVDGIYEAARKAGAVGGKIAGAGGGGFMLLFVPPDRHRHVCSQFESLIHVPFQFERAGSQIIFYDPEEDFALAEQSRDQQTILPFRELTETGGE